MREIKVFGIGLNKTGTTTLGTALHHLGYRHKGWDPKIFALHKRGAISDLLSQTCRFDSFSDWPWPLMTDTLLDHFGDSARFILTRRCSARVWLDSLKAHALLTAPSQNPRRAVFGYDYPQQNEAAHLAFYNTHLAETRARFARRGKSHLLKEICWEDGDSWQQLCTWLREPVPDCPLPHKNDRTKRRNRSPMAHRNHRRLQKLMHRTHCTTSSEPMRNKVNHAKAP